MGYNYGIRCIPSLPHPPCNETDPVQRIPNVNATLNLLTPAEGRHQG
jgi:hypothetical protein